MLKTQLNQVWDQLRAKKPHLPFFLEEIRIQNLRGIKDLNVRFNYPVSVLAGPNACGKSTVLFALTCAYKVPTSKFFPAAMFPDFRSQSGDCPSDKPARVGLEFYYINEGQRYQMRWSRGTKKWNKSFLGRKKGVQPQRKVYLRTLANLSNPSEIRSVLQLGRRELRKEEITAELLTFAHRILPLRYRQLLLLSHKGKDLLYALREDGSGPSYSEFHMSAGERAVLRLSKDISSPNMTNAMILIDELEAGLHPLTQQQLMLELQRLALQNSLQIVVATHSSTILDTVPPEGRIFLERTEDNVEVLPLYRDLIQRSFYGGSLDKLYVLCEDEEAEALMRGVLWVLNPRLRFMPEDIEVGRDAGRSEFPQHVRALAKFKQLESFIFLVDGDGEGSVEEAKIRQAASDYGQPIRLLFLPGDISPEGWVWKQIRENIFEYAQQFGVPEKDFTDLFNNVERSFEGLNDSPRNIEKGRLTAFAGHLKRDLNLVCYEVGRMEAQRETGEMAVFLKKLEEAIQAWRNLLTS